MNSYPAGATFPLSSLSLATSKLRLWFVPTRFVLVCYLIEIAHLLPAKAAMFLPIYRHRRTCLARLIAAAAALSFLFDLYLSNQELP
jgi:hypothetical protein